MRATNVAALPRSGVPRTFMAEVAAARTVHRHLREITLAGDDLRNFVSAGPDSFVYLLLPPPGRTTLTIDRGFTWDGYREMPDADRPVGAYYTVRRARPAVGRLDLLVVLHDHPGAAASWAARARPGEPVALWGPRTTFEPAATTDRYLLIADDTALPATAAILESLPTGTPVRVLAEIGVEADRRQLPASSAWDVTWLHRNGAPPGTTSLLLDAVRREPRPTATTYVWGGGESRTMAAVRRHLRHEMGVAREAVALIAYWRRAGSSDQTREDG